MKIVKSFSSTDYAIKMNNRWIEGSFLRQEILKDLNPFLEWGLSSDGNLCCRGCFGHCNYPAWVHYEICCFSISLVEMKKIVDQFGHLLIFI